VTSDENRVLTSRMHEEDHECQNKVLPDYLRCLVSVSGSYYYENIDSEDISIDVNDLIDDLYIANTIVVVPEGKGHGETGIHIRESCDPHTISC
jgi:hypothetical protein